MADKKDAKKEEKKEQEGKKKGFNFKIILIGVPLFVLQLVIVYFVTANFLVKPALSAHAEQVKEHGDEGEEAEAEEAEEEEDSGESFIYPIEDLIINPAHTNGKRLLLLSVGFEVKSEEAKKKLEEREVIVRDMIISTLSKKTLHELNNPQEKDSLKIELSEQIKKLIPKTKIKNVYFSKYVLN